MSLADELKQLNAQLINRDEKTLMKIGAIYSNIWSQLQKELVSLLEEYRKTGKTTYYYQSLYIEQMLTETQKYLEKASLKINLVLSEDVKKRIAEAGAQYAQIIQPLRDSSLALSLGPSAITEKMVASIQLELKYLNFIKSLAGFNRDKTKDILLKAMVKQENPLKIAKVLKREIFGTATSRASIIARTELVRAQRKTFSLTMLDNGIKRWRWRCAPDACPVCQELNGQVFDSEDAVQDHPNGRCWMEPLPNDAKVKSPISDRLERFEDPIWGAQYKLKEGF